MILTRRRWLIVLALAAAGCSRKAAPTPAGGPAAGAAPPVATDATPTPTGTAAMLFRPKTTDEEFQAAIVVLQAANAEDDAAAALANGDHRLFAIRGAVLEAPGVTGDWRTLPKGAYVAAIAGTSAEGGSKYQQRYQMLAHAYAARYNPLLLSRLM